MTDIQCIGHITHDKVITPERTIEMPGGTAWYFAKTMRHFEEGNFSLLTRAGKESDQAVDELAAYGVDVKNLGSADSVYFENRYGANQNERTQRVLAKADQFTIKDISSLDSKIFHLGALLEDDFEDGFIQALAKRGEVSADAQGFLRRVEGHRVYACEWRNMQEVLPYMSFLKANEHEMEQMTGESDPDLAAAKLLSLGVKEAVLTLGDKGSLIARKDGCWRVPAFQPREVVDATGCGDTYMAVYLQQRLLGENPMEAGILAAKLCTLKIQRHGGVEAEDFNLLNTAWDKSQ